MEIELLKVPGNWWITHIVHTVHSKQLNLISIYISFIIITIKVCVLYFGA